MIKLIFEFIFYLSKLIVLLISLYKFFKSSNNDNLRGMVFLGFCALFVG